MPFIIIVLIILVILIFLVKNDNNEKVSNNNASEDIIDEENGIFILNGRNGIVKVEKGIVSISREGIMGFLASETLNTGEKRILIKNILSVELGKNPSEMLASLSYIKFVTAGDDEVRHSYTKSGLFETKAGQLFNDPNTIQISNNEQYEIALRIRDYIENYQANQGTSTQALSGADEILKYKKLLDDGILTQEEFDAKKKQLLGL